MFPVIMTVALVAVQAGIFLHGANAAGHIAAQGAMAAASLRASEEVAVRATKDAADAVGARLAAVPEISITRSQASARVSVAIPRAMPFFPESVSRRVVVPRERYISFLER